MQITQSYKLEAIQIFTDFLANHPTDDKILNFTFPQKTEVRVQELVEKNSAGSITPDELVELKEYERLDTYGGLLKTKIKQRQKQSSISA